MKTLAIEGVPADFNEANKKALIAFNPLFEKVFAFIETHDIFSLPEGRHIVDGDNVFCNVGSSEARERKDAKLEAHKVYIDMQCLVAGEYEEQGVLPLEQCKTIRVPYDPAGDITFYSDPWTQLVRVKRGQFIIYTPQTGHAPNISPTPIRKCVFKVRAEPKAGA